MAEYSDILKKSWDELPEPQVLPTGSWRLRLSNATYQPAKSADKTDVVLFVYSPQEPMADVNESELAALGAEYDVQSNRIFSRFFVADNADWQRVRKHIIKHGIKAEGKIEKSLKDLKGTDVVAFLTQRTFTTDAGDTVTTNEAQNFAPVA